jgi:hypothetical protein
MKTRSTYAKIDVVIYPRRAGGYTMVSLDVSKDIESVGPWNVWLSTDQLKGLGAALRWRAFDNEYITPCVSREYKGG